MTIEDIISKIDRVKHLDEVIAGMELRERIPASSLLFGDYLSAVSEGSSIEELKKERDSILRTEI